MSTAVYEIPLAVDLAAVGIGAVQGALVAATVKDRRIDVFGVTMIGVLMGFGGGIIRAVLLSQVPMALQNNLYLIVAVGAALLGMALQSVFHRMAVVITVLDAVALGLFAVLGTTAALSLSLPALPALFVGVASAVGGGILRDLFLNQPIAVMHVGSLYAVAAAGGSLAVVVMVMLGVPVAIAGTVGVVLTVVIRLAAVKFGISLPEQRPLRLRP